MRKNEKLGEMKMNTFKAVNTKAKSIGFSTTQIAMGHIMIILLLASLLLMFGKTTVFAYYNASEVQAEELTISKNQAEKAALGLMGYGYDVENSYATTKDGNKAFVVELSYNDGVVTYGYSEYVIVVETGNPDKPLRRSTISQAEINLLK